MSHPPQRQGTEINGRTSKEELLQEIERLRSELAGLRGQGASQDSADDAVRRAEEIHDAATKAKEQFVAVLSHELRTPLTPVLATATTMENDSRLPEDLREDVRLIRRNVQLEARLVDDLLDLTGIGAGTVRLHFEMVDAHHLATEAVEVSRTHIDLKQLSINLNLLAKTPHVWADPARFQQALWNVIRNAIKFTPEGGEITVRSENEGQQFVLRIIDNGIGIESEYINRIFDAFDQGNTAVTRPYGGVGLGLTISKTLIDAHGGKISAASGGAGQGSVFTISMPLADALLVNCSRTDSGPRDIKNRSLKVLLVEDHDDTRRIMARLLGSYGYQVTTANDVKSAIEQFDASEFDILISDIGLPDGSGWDLVRSIRNKRPVKAIALSGLGTAADVERSKDAGFNAHLTKPIDPRRLDQAINELTS